jgi:DNA-binding LacI/PurR family transcriptional regulator
MMISVIKMTMKELAALCHVSVSAVSKAFCDADDISEETKQHIFEVAKEQGCFGKFYKGKYHKKIIAVICHELSGGYYAIFLEKLQELIEKNDGICIISTDNFISSKQAELIEYYVSYLKVDGIIVLGLTEPLKKGYDTPIVSVFSSVDSRVDSVVTDMKSAIYEAVSTLYSLGHKNIGFISEVLTSSKKMHFESATKKFSDINAFVTESNKRFEEAGIDGINRLFNKTNNLTAIICAYDNIALGAIKRLKEMGLNVPEDVSVIGIDNIHVAGFTETSLTSIDTNPNDICNIAYELLSKKIKNKYFKVNQSIVINSKIVIRESIGKAREENESDS